MILRDNPSVAAPLRHPLLHREGENSHCHGFAATPPSKREARTPTVAALPRHLPQRGRQGYRRHCCQFRPQGRLPSAAGPCLRILALMRKSEPPRAILLRNSGGEKNRTQSQRRTLGFSSPHGISFCQFKKKFVNAESGERVCEPRPPPRYFYGCGYRSITYSIIAHHGRLVKSLEAIRNRRRRRPRPRRPRRRPKENRSRRP